MADDEYAAFMGLVMEQVGSRLISPAPDDYGSIELLPESADAQMKVVQNLANLARLCRVIDRRDWPQAVADHFAIFSDRTPVPSTFEEVAQRLRIRLVPDQLDLGDRSTSEILIRPITHGLSAVVGLFAGPAFYYIMSPSLEKWHVNESTVLEAALENLRQRPLPEIRGVGDEKTPPLTFVFDEENYESSYLLALERLLDPVPPLGAIAVIPSRDTLAFAPVRDRSILGSIMGAVLYVREAYVTEPWPLSTDVYWWRDGNLSILGVQVERQELVCDARSEFADIIETLPWPD